MRVRRTVSPAGLPSLCCQLLSTIPLDSALGYPTLEGADVARRLAELDPDQVDRLAQVTVLLGVATVDELSQGGAFAGEAQTDGRMPLAPVPSFVDGEAAEELFGPLEELPDRVEQEALAERRGRDRKKWVPSASLMIWAVLSA